MDNVADINFIAQLATTLSFVAAVILGLMGWRIAKKEYLDTRDRKKVENALELARFYVEVLLPESTLVKTVLVSIDSNGEYYNAIDGYAKTNTLQHFSLSELNLIFPTPTRLDAIKQMMTELSGTTIIDAKIRCCTNSEELGKLVELDAKLKCDSKTTTSLHQEFRLYLQNLANKLEWFAMNFNHNVADERKVYPSLHQTFFDLVHRLYYYISVKNVSEFDRLYSNIRELYVLWYKRYQNAQRTELRSDTTMQAEIKGKNLS